MLNFDEDLSPATNAFRTSNLLPDNKDKELMRQAAAANLSLHPPADEAKKSRVAFAVL